MLRRDRYRLRWFTPTVEVPLCGHATLAAGAVVVERLEPGRDSVVFDTASGQVRYDNYSGRWGDQAHLDRFLQAYACERAKIEARKKGHVCTEQTLVDGSIKLTIQLAGGAA